MAMNAKQAAELIKSGKFDNVDELYDVLNGNKEYNKEFEILLQYMAKRAQKAANEVKKGHLDDVDELYAALKRSDKHKKEFETLLNHIQDKTKKDIDLYKGLADSAQAVDKLNAEINPLDDKDEFFADMRKKLSRIEFYQTVEENGKSIVKVVAKEDSDQMIAQIIAAAKMEANVDLRGATNQESVDAQKFMNASEAEKKSIYKDKIKEKVDLAIIQSILIKEHERITRELDEKYLKYEQNKDKKNEAQSPEKIKEILAEKEKELKEILAKKEKEIAEKINKLSDNLSEKISIGVDAAAYYCATAAAGIENKLAEYKTNIKNIAIRVNKGLAKLKDKGRDLCKQWQKVRTQANKTFEACNKKLADGIVAFNESCKHIWKNKYEIAANVAKKLYDKKYEIGADMLAAAGFAFGVATGGVAAGVAGGVYAAYTIGRRVVYEAYKQKKENPQKSYKEIYSNKKFITKAVFTTIAAGVSCAIAGTAASTGAEVIVTETAKQIAAQKMIRRGVNLGGSVASNIVGVVNAKNKDERKHEIKSLGLSVLGAAAAMYAAEISDFDKEQTEIGHDDAKIIDEHQKLDDAKIVEEHQKSDDAKIVEEHQESGKAKNTEEIAAENKGEVQNKKPDNDEEYLGDLTMLEFPNEWNENMGISSRQFETLKNWYDKLDTTDGAGMDVFYTHASKYAASLSIDTNNPMTAEQVLFKFSRLAAITSVKTGEYGTIGTGTLGKQLNNIYHLLGCDDKLTAEQMLEARKTLDICTLNEAGRQDGRMDAEKFFAVAGDAHRGLPVDPDGTLTMTRHIRVIGEGTNCGQDDRRVMYEDVKSSDKKEDTVVQLRSADATPVVEEKLPEAKPRIKVEGKAEDITVKIREETEKDPVMYCGMSGSAVDSSDKLKNLTEKDQVTNKYLERQAKRAMKRYLARQSREN